MTAACLLAAFSVAPCFARQQGQQQDAHPKSAATEEIAAEQRFAAGDFKGAAAAFGKELEARRDDPALLYNLALSQWRAGDLGAAEDAIDRYAAVPGGGRPDLHHGLLGNIRYRQAEALVREAIGGAAPTPLQPRAAAAADPGAERRDPMNTLEDAAEKARAACDAFVRAAGDGAPSPEIARNAERALRLLRDIEKQLEELKKQRDEQPKQDGKDEQGKDEDKPGKQKQDDEPQGQQDEKAPDQGAQDQKQDQEQKDDADSKDGTQQGGERPEPEPDATQQDKSQDKPQDQQQGGQQQDPTNDSAANEPEGQQKPEPKPQEDQAEGAPEGAQQAQRTDAPGEQAEATELSPEQRARLLEQLKDLDARMRKLRMQSRARRPVDRDW